MTANNTSPTHKSRRTTPFHHAAASAASANTVMAACTGIQNRCSGTPPGGWITANNAGGDALQSGLTTTPW